MVLLQFWKFSLWIETTQCTHMTWDKSTCVITQVISVIWTEFLSFPRSVKHDLSLLLLSGFIAGHFPLTHLYKFKYKNVKCLTFYSRPMIHLVCTKCQIVVHYVLNSSKFPCLSFTPKPSVCHFLAVPIPLSQTNHLLSAFKLLFTIHTLLSILQLFAYVKILITQSHIRMSSAQGAFSNNSVYDGLGGI